MKRHLKTYARPALTGLAVVALALLLWWAYRSARPRPRLHDGGELQLLVLVDDDEPETIRTQRLVRYPVKDGEVGPGEVVWAGDVWFFGRGRQNPTRIVDERYVVSGRGGVLDLGSGKVIRDDPATLRGVEGGKVIYTLMMSMRNLHISFDLKTGKTTVLEDDEKWALPGLLSPDGAKGAVEGRSGIRVYRAGKEVQPLGNDFHVSYSVHSSTSGEPPMLWLDDDRLLTQLDNGRLVVVNVEDGSRSRPLDVPASKRIAGEPQLWRDAEGGIVYECGRGAILVDADAGRWRRYQWQRLGHGFEVSMETEERTIRYEGRRIGRFPVLPGSEAVTDGHIAFTSEGRSGQCVRVWSAWTARWTVLDGEDSCDRVIGWVK